LKKKSLQSVIDQMVLRIVERFDPERIILFGSAARGEAGPDSDVDLLVVMRVQGSRREKAVQIGVAVNDIPIPKDIFVTTPEDFELRKEIVGTIERPAGLEGRLVYARR
jgi:uncharacterized protein